MLSEESLWFRSFTSQVLYYVFCKMQWVLKKILVSDGENRCLFLLWLLFATGQRGYFFLA